MQTVLSNLLVISITAGCGEAPLAALCRTPNLSRDLPRVAASSGDVFACPLELHTTYQKTERTTYIRETETERSLRQIHTETEKHREKDRERDADHENTIHKQNVSTNHSGYHERRTLSTAQSLPEVWQPIDEENRAECEKRRE